MAARNNLDVGGVPRLGEDAGGHGEVGLGQSVHRGGQLAELGQVDGGARVELTLHLVLDLDEDAAHIPGGGRQSYGLLHILQGLLQLSVGILTLLLRSMRGWYHMTLWILTSAIFQGQREG